MTKMIFVNLPVADLPRAKEIAVDGRVLVFTLAISMLTGIIFGFVPALQASRPDLNEALKSGGHGAGAGSSGNRTRNVLVVVEVALSLVLLVGASLAIRGFVEFVGNQAGVVPVIDRGNASDRLDNGRHRRIG